MLAARFHALHAERNGFARPDDPIEVVTGRAEAVGPCRRRRSPTCRCRRRREKPTPGAGPFSPSRRPRRCGGRAPPSGLARRRSGRRPRHHRGAGGHRPSSAPASGPGCTTAEPWRSNGDASIRSPSSSPGSRLADDRRRDGCRAAAHGVLAEHQGAGRLLGGRLRTERGDARTGRAHPGPPRLDARIGCGRDRRVRFRSRLRACSTPSTIRSTAAPI